MLFEEKRPQIRSKDLSSSKEIAATQVLRPNY